MKNNRGNAARLWPMLGVLLAVALVASAQQYIEKLSEIAFVEKSSAITATAGTGRLYVKNTTPSTLVFVDDTGSETTLGAGGSGINQLTGDVTAGPGTGSQAATIAAAAVEMGMIDASGTASSSTYLRGDGAWATPAGSGDVSKVGTPVDTQIGVWTGDGTIEGDSAFTFDTSDDTLAIGASGKLAFGAVDAFSDSAGTLTLGNVDAIDATTEATIEAAIDTLANVTSIATHTVPGGTGTFALTSDIPVDSVNGQTGTVALDADDIDDTSTTNKFVTASDVTNLGNLSGTNSGDVTVAGLDYASLSSQEITFDQIDVTTDITGAVPVANGGTGTTNLLGIQALLNTPSAVTSTSNSVAWNSDSARTFTHTLSENTTIAASSGSLFAGQFILFRITQGSGPYTLAWNAQFTAGEDFSDTIPAVSTTSGDVDYYIFYYDGTNFDLLDHRLH